MKQNSKRYKEIFKSAVKDKKISLKDALDLVKKNSTAKFDESIDVSLRINLKQSKGGDFSLRTVVNLPNGSGKKNKVAVLCESEKVDEAKKAGAEIVGSDDLLEKIASGKFNFTKLICTPSMMGKVGKHGKVLGPKGLMPNPKTGTVTMDVGKAVSDVKAGKIDFKVDKTGIVHAPIGKVSFSPDKISGNANELIQTLIKLKPTSAKGTYIKSIFMSSTMSPSLAIETKF